MLKRQFRSTSITRIAPTLAVVALAFVVASIVAGCRGGGANPGEEDLVIPFVQPTPSERLCRNDEYPPNAPRFEEVEDTDYRTDAEGLGHIILTEGSGPVPEEDWQVTVHYTGWLESGCIFGSTYIGGQEASFFVLGVIPGWRQSILDMKVGERRRIRIPPELGYGVAGSPPRIPANATLVFDVVLSEAISNDDAWATATVIVDAAQKTATAVSEEVAATFTAIAEEATAEAEASDTEEKEEADE